MTFVVMWYLFSLKMVYKVEREFFFGVEDCYPVETVAWYVFFFFFLFIFLFFLGVIAIETIPRENDSFIVQNSIIHWDSRAT